MKTKIVLIPITDDTRTGRKDAEGIENSTFEDKQQLADTFFGGDVNLFRIVELTDFMDMCNNQELYLDDYWVSYVNIGS